MAGKAPPLYLSSFRGTADGAILGTGNIFFRCFPFFLIGFLVLGLFGGLFLRSGRNDFRSGHCYVPFRLLDVHVDAGLFGKSTHWGGLITALFGKTLGFGIRDFLKNACGFEPLEVLVLHLDHLAGLTEFSVHIACAHNLCLHKLVFSELRLGYETFAVPGIGADDHDRGINSGNGNSRNDFDVTLESCELHLLTTSGNNLGNGRDSGVRST